MEDATDWHRENKAKRGKYVLENSLLCDCSFLVGEKNEQKEFKANKTFLAMASPVFETMFYGSLPEKGDGIVVEDVTAKVFEFLLQFVYTDTANIENFHDACSVCYAARKYLMSDLEEMCVEKMQKFLSPETACHAYECANFLDNKALADGALKIIVSKSTEVLQSPGIEEVHLSTLEFILDRNSLAIDSELDLFHAVSRWAQSECRRQGRGEDGEFLRAVAGPLLRKVRFLTLRPQQLAQGPAASALLSREESYALLMNVSAPGGCPVPLPLGFSDSTDIRSVTRRAIRTDMWFSLNTTSDTKCVIVSFEGRKGMYISGVTVIVCYKTSFSLGMWESGGALDEQRTLVAKVPEQIHTGNPSAQNSTIVVRFRNRYPVKVQSKYDIVVKVADKKREYIETVVGSTPTVQNIQPDECEILIGRNSFLRSLIVFSEEGLR